LIVLGSRCPSLTHHDGCKATLNIFLKEVDVQRVLVLGTVVLVAVVFAVRIWAAPPAKTFQGYWIGVDPIDGGDQRRSVVLGEDGTLSVVGRDSFLRLCDSTDRGVVTVDDGVLIGRDTVTTDNLTLACLNTGAIVVLKARYELVNDGLMIEDLTTQDAAPVQRLVLHRISH
jgi:hypothetical protein